ncbi:MAG: Ku protein [Longimicrobiales bacterium]
MARAIGTAQVSFGLVTVPVKLYSATDTTSGVSFNWIHKDCGSRLKMQYICAQDGEVVERDDMVKGYEFSRGQYVLFSEDELKALEAQGNSQIDISEFVPVVEVDRLYVDKTYYLGPDKGGARAYLLLAAALEETGLAALARYAARGKQYLVLVRPREGGLVMEQLKYADEVRPFSEVPIDQGEVRKEELKLAVQLVEQAASTSFDPAPYRDDVRERVLELIQKKVEGEDITQAPAEVPQTQVIDLMEALKASLAKSGEAERKPARRAGTKKPASKKSGRRKSASG